MSQPQTNGVFSLQARLRWGLLVILLLVFATLWVAATVTIHKLVEHYLTTRLQHDAEMLATHLHRHNGQWLLDEHAIGPIYRQANSGHYFVIEADGQRISSPSLAGYPLWTPAAPPGNPYETPAPAMREKPAPGQPQMLEPVLVHLKQANIAGHPVRIYVAEDHTPIQHYLYWFDGIFALVALAALGLTAWLTRRLVRRGFASLTPLEQRLRDHRSHSGSFHLPNGLPSEVMPLAQALQHSLQAQSEQLKRYRHANADLAHAMKTPLHLIFQQLDQPALRDCPEIRQRLQQQAERLRALVERELKSARLAGNTWQGRPFSLNEDLPQLLEAMQQLHPEKRIMADLPENCHWPMEREDAFELLGTVLDNACKWADSRVTIHWQKHPEGVCLHIDDDGPGVPEAQRQNLIRRGHRLDESIPGDGLGLAIAEDILHRYQGRLEFTQSPAGGLRVTLLMPDEATSTIG